MPPNLPFTKEFLKFCIVSKTIVFVISCTHLNTFQCLVFSEKFSWQREEPREGSTPWSTGHWKALQGNLTSQNFKCLPHACSFAKARCWRNPSPYHRAPEGEGVNPRATYGSTGTVHVLLPDQSANPVFFRKLNVLSAKERAIPPRYQVSFKV